jgi:Xaa-Pro aminopeptidase
MRDLYGQRRERILQQLRSEDLDAVLVSSVVNVTYLTGFSGDSSYLIVSPDKTLIVSDGRYTTQLAQECPGLEAHIRPPSQTLQQAVADVLQKMHVGSVEFESADLTVAHWTTLTEQTPKVVWKGNAGRVEALRAVKDEWELEQIQRAIGMAERAFAMFRSMLRGKDTEKELTDALEMYIRRAGGRCSSFPPIVAAGPQAALPHAQPTEAVVAEHDHLLIDWGVSGPFYKSDLTRVLLRRTKSPSSGAPSTARLAEVYETVLRAQGAAISQVGPGARTGDVDAAARAVISAAGYGDYFTHSVGHGIGLQIHEAPLMRPGSDVELRPGMVVTVEPGIYLPGWGGIRIEDDVLVTADGCEVLTSVPREFESQFVEW